MHYAGGIGRYAFSLASGPVYRHLVEVSVMDVVFADPGFPHASFESVQPELGPVFPVRERAGKPDVGGVWCQLSENPAAVLVAVQPVITVCVGKPHDVSVRVGGYSPEDAFSALMTLFDGLCERFKPRVVAEYGEVFFHFRILFYL